MKTPPVFWSLLLYLQAGIYKQIGKPEQGLALINQIPGNPDSGSGRTLVPEFFQLKGDLLFASSPDNAAEAELWLQQALEIARDLQANMMELRITISLFRLWHEQGKAEQGKQLLKVVLEKFTEGFEAADLIEASELLKDIRKN